VIEKGTAVIVTEIVTATAVVETAVATVAEIATTDPDRVIINAGRVAEVVIEIVAVVNTVAVEVRKNLANHVAESYLCIGTYLLPVSNTSLRCNTKRCKVR
jgi:hypothetical protein